MGDTVVVIGPGPASAGLNGARIDNYPVVRMWNHEWQPADRYGSRYDYGLVTAMDDLRYRTRTPTTAWLLYNVTHEKIVPSVGTTRVVLLDHMRWYAGARALGASSASGRGLKFTRGFAAVAGAIACLRPKRVIVIGMDILRNGVTGPHYYDRAALPFYVSAYPALAKGCPEWAADQPPVGLRRDGPHDYFAEAALIRMMAAEAKAELVWDDADCSENGRHALDCGVCCGLGKCDCGLEESHE